MPVGHHPHGSPPYVNGVPPSPRRHSGPTMPSPYTAPYPGPAPPHHMGTHDLSNGTAAPPSRPEGGYHPSAPYGERPLYTRPADERPTSSRNGYPPPPPPASSRHDGDHPSYVGRQRFTGPPEERSPTARPRVPNSQEPPGSAGSMGPRTDSRPTSGASANPSLRNLLS